MLLLQELVYFDMFMSGVVAASLVVIVLAVREYRSTHFVPHHIQTYSLLTLIAFIVEV